MPQFDTNDILTALIAAVTLGRWYWDKQFAKSLDIDRLTRDIATLRTDHEELCRVVEQVPQQIRENKREVIEHLDREVLHLREVVISRCGSCSNYKGKVS